MYNYGQLQVVFEDGSVGWYEAGWGPMMSEVAYFVKDVVGPRGCVSIVDADAGERAADSSDKAEATRRRLVQTTCQDEQALTVAISTANRVAASRSPSFG